MNLSNFSPIPPTGSMGSMGYNKHGRHRTKWVVKVLSGINAGNVVPCDSQDDAQEIVCYLADIEGVCGDIKAPLYS